MRSFFMVSTPGRCLVFVLLFIYYYLDRVMGVLFCSTVVAVYYTKKREPFFFYENNSNLHDGNVCKDDTSNIANSEADFRKKNCVGDELHYKGKSVKSEMVEHVFPEINFSGDPCNICDKKCQYSVIEPEDSEQDKLHVSTLM